MKSVKFLSLIALVLAFAITCQAANIAWVSDGQDRDSDGIADDNGWVDLLTNAGYNVTRYDMTFQNGNGGPNAAILNAADLVIVSRDTNSGQYNNQAWNTDINTGLILMSAYLTRNTRLKWMDTGDVIADAGLPTVDIDGGMFVMKNIPFYIEAGSNNVSLNDGTTGVGNGFLIAVATDSPLTVAGAQGAVVIAEWSAGVEFYDGAGVAPAGDRLFFAGGTRENAEIGPGVYNLNAFGEAIFLNSVENMIPEPATMLLLGLGSLALVRRRR
jgi:hypothetical protein